MLADADLVKTMKDHATLYYRPEAFERLDFLYHAQQPAQTFQEAFPTFYQNHSECMDLREDLTGLIDHYLAHNIDTIVIDQTAPEHALHGFRCVKVLMPGMLPMTFGQRYRRITGLPRLYQLPTVLGYRQSALNEEEINPYPHPFP